MLEINVEADLAAVTAQIGALVEETNKMTQSRDTLIQQVQNLSGIAMYLRGKLPTDEPAMAPTEMEPDISFERTEAYPEEGGESV
jgi:hypothetical protein|tara:strand:- start:387 stop:641 length:255 start_codon:yes stop_codon:yes gene_type:complete